MWTGARVVSRAQAARWHGGRATAAPATRRALLGSAVHGSAVAAAALLLRLLPAILAADSRCASERPPATAENAELQEGWPHANGVLA